MGVWGFSSSTAATMLPAATRGGGFGLLATVNGVGCLQRLVGSLWVISSRAAMAFVIVMSLAGATIIAWAGSKAAREKTE